MPDPNWTRRHLHDVRAVWEAAALCATEPQVVQNADGLANALLSEWRLVQQPPEGLRPALSTAAAIGFGFAALYEAGKPTPPEIYDGVQWAALTVTPTQPKDYVAAFVFSLHAGHYVGRTGDVDTVRRQMDWLEAYSVSARAAVMQEAMLAAWEALNSQRRP